MSRGASAGEDGGEVGLYFCIFVFLFLYFFIFLFLYFCILYFVFLHFCICICVFVFLYLCVKDTKFQRDSPIFAKRLDSRLETYAKEVDKKVRRFILIYFEFV